MPVTSPIAQTPSPALMRRVDLDAAAARLDADASRGPIPSTRGRRPVATSRRSPRSSVAVRRARARTRRPSRRAAGASWPRWSSMPSAASASPSASPSACGSRGEHVLGALDDRHRAPHAGERLAQLDADRARRRGRSAGAAPRFSAGRLAVRPDAVELAQPRDRRDHRVRAGGDDDVARRCSVLSPTATRPGPASRPAPRITSMPALSAHFDLAGVVVVADHEVAPGEGRGGVDVAASTASRAPGASRAACSASPGRSSVFDGMQAQYEHSPPSSSRSTIATRSPPSARRAGAVLAGRAAAEDDRRRSRAHAALPRLVDLPGGGDQPDVAEGLREVAELLAVRGVDLLGEQAEVVRVARELVEQRLGALDLARLAPGRRRARTSRSRTCPPRRSGRRR